MFWLLNSAVVTAEGTWTYRLLSRTQAQTWLLVHVGKATSRIGYHQTAEHIHALCRVWVAESREASVMAVGDEALVVRLPYRVADPTRKGEVQPVVEWEYGLLRRMGG